MIMALIPKHFYVQTNFKLFTLRDIVWIVGTEYDDHGREWPSLVFRETYPDPSVSCTVKVRKCLPNFWHNTSRKNVPYISVYVWARNDVDEHLLSAESVLFIAQRFFQEFFFFDGIRNVHGKEVPTKVKAIFVNHVNFEHINVCNTALIPSVHDTAVVKSGQSKIKIKLSVNKGRIRKCAVKRDSITHFRRLCELRHRPRPGTDIIQRHMKENDSY